jgi:hypothetical protein
LSYTAGTPDQDVDWISFPIQRSRDHIPNIDMHCMIRGKFIEDYKCVFAVYCMHKLFWFFLLRLLFRQVNWGSPSEPLCCSEMSGGRCL